MQEFSWSVLLRCQCPDEYTTFSFSYLFFYFSIRYLANRQPGRALPYVLRLRRQNVFDLIREHNLFTDVQNQALLLVEFDQELVKRRREAGEDEGLDKDGRSPAIALLADHTFSIPVGVDSHELTELSLNRARRYRALCNNSRADRTFYTYTSTLYLQKTRI